MQYAVIIAAVIRSQVSGSRAIYSSPAIDEISSVRPAAILNIISEAMDDNAYTAPLRVRRKPRELVKENVESPLIRYNAKALA